MSTIARNYRTGRWVRCVLDGAVVSEFTQVDGPDVATPEDDWIAPAFWDVQVNGRWGISFSDPALTMDQVATIVRAQAALGTARLCPTLITAAFEDMLHGVATIAAACDAYPDVAARVVGIHLEGPHLSAEDGYRGAHPLSAIRDPDWAEFEALQAASGGRILLMTLAPERPGAIEFIRSAVGAGVTVALGHTAADGPTLRAAAAAGARLSTHLGNGIAATLPRHPNPIWEQAALDLLAASLIADGEHLDAATLRVLVRAKGPERIILVSDASPLAGLPPGRHGDWEVEPSGRIVVAGTPYLAGSNGDLERGVNHLLEHAGLPLEAAIATATRLPALLLGREAPELAAGAAANLLIFRNLPVPDGTRMRLRKTCVDGLWTDADPSPSQSRP